MKKIVTGAIEPIRADKLRLSALADLDAPAGPTVHVPVQVPGVFSPKLVSSEPLVATEETLEHAQEVAEKMLQMAPQMPVNALSGDLLSLACAVLHYRNQR